MVKTTDKRRRSLSEEHKRKIGKGNKGKKRSEATKRKISETKTGTKMSLETRRNMSLAHIGQIRPPRKEETKKKISKSLMGNKICLGRKLSDETKQKIGDANRGLKRTEEQIKDISKRNTGLKRSEESKKRYSLSKMGTKNPWWNPNLTTEERTIKRNFIEYREWRLAVYRRDRYTCQICNDRVAAGLCAHHIMSYKDNEELRLDIDNGITLCKACHHEFHNKYGCGENNKVQFEQFIANLEWVSDEEIEEWT